MSTPEQDIQPDSDNAVKHMIWSSLRAYVRRRHTAAGLTLAASSVGGIVATGLELGTTNTDTAVPFLFGLAAFGMGMVHAFSRPEPEYWVAPTLRRLTRYEAHLPDSTHAICYDMTFGNRPVAKVLPASLPFEQEPDELQAA